MQMLLTLLDGYPIILVNYFLERRRLIGGIATAGGLWYFAKELLLYGTTVLLVYFFLHNSKVYLLVTKLKQPIGADTSIKT